MEYRDILKKKVEASISSDKKLSEVFRKIDEGMATYDEAFEFGLRMSEIYGKGFLETFSYIVDLPAEELLMLVNDVSIQTMNMTALICDTVQEQINDRAGIGLKAVKTEIQQAQADEIVSAIASVKNEEALRTALASALQDHVLNIVDVYATKNASFQSKAGLKSYVIRTWDGKTGSHDTRHTDWCSRLEGRYEYGEQPKNFFARHSGCGCKITFETEKVKEKSERKPLITQKDVKAMIQSL